MGQGAGAIAPLVTQESEWMSSPFTTISVPPPFSPKKGMRKAIGFLATADRLADNLVLVRIIIPRGCDVSLSRNLYVPEGCMVRLIPTRT